MGYDQNMGTFAFMIAVGVGPEVEEAEIRKLSTKGNSLHIKNFDSLKHINDNILQSIATSCLDERLSPAPLRNVQVPSVIKPMTPRPTQIPVKTTETSSRIDNRQHFKYIPTTKDNNFSVYIEQNIRTLKVQQGEDVSLKCSANSSVPGYVLAWFKDDVKEVSGARTTSNTNGVLVLKNVGESDSGYYKCIGSNIYKTDEISVKVIVTIGLRTSSR